jgi:Outer membrane lipoprotein-sorting protein
MSSDPAARPPAWLPAFLAAAALAFAGEARAAGSLEEVVDCAIRNLPPSAHGVAKLVTRTGAGEATLEVDYWSQTTDPGGRKIVIAERNAPSDVTSAYLFSDGDAIGEVWAFTRADGKPRRIKATGPEARLFASSMSLEDFARFARVVFPGQVRRLEDAKIGGRDVYVIETRPAPDAGSEYARIVTSIDREWCLILRRESFDASFERGARPRKVYSVEPADVRLDGKFANAKRAQQVDAVDGSSTQMEVQQLELPAKVEDAFFTPDALPSASH